MELIFFFFLLFFVSAIFCQTPQEFLEILEKSKNNFSSSQLLSQPASPATSVYCYNPNDYCCGTGNRVSWSKCFCAVGWGGSRCNFPLFTYSQTLSAGGKHTCAILPDPETKSLIPWCTADNARMQLGVENVIGTNILTKVDFSKNVEKEPNVDLQFRYVSAGKSHTLAINSKFELFGWGYNSEGQLGINSTQEFFANPVKITDVEGSILKGRKIVQVCAGAAHSLALDMWGYVYVWGSNLHGQANDCYSNLNTYLPRNVTDSISPVIFKRNYVYGRRILQIACGEETNYLLTDYGEPITFGRNVEGQLGLGLALTSTQSLCDPMRLDRGTTSSLNSERPVVFVAAGNFNGYAIDYEGLVHAWGSNSNGALGAGWLAQTKSMSPVLMDYQGALKGRLIIRISGGFFYGALMDMFGEVLMFGNAEYLGMNLNPQNHQLSPVLLTNSSFSRDSDWNSSLARKTIDDISCGMYHSWVSAYNGEIIQKDEKPQFYSFGAGLLGQLGTETFKSSNFPIKVPCRKGYGGENCEIMTCYKTFFNDSSTKITKQLGDPVENFDYFGACSGHGLCVGGDKCDCFPKNEYFLDDCSGYSCFGIFWNETSKVCTNGRGKCELFNKCACKPGYYGKACEMRTIGKILDDLWTQFNNDTLLPFYTDYKQVLFLGLILFGSFLGCCLCCTVFSIIFVLFAVIFGLPCTLIIGIIVATSCFKNKMAKQKKEIFEKLLETEEMEEQNTKIDMTVFNLDFKDYRIVQELSAGGSGALCCEAIDKRTDETVFIKLFALKRSEGSEEYDLGQFKNEINLFLRLRHPNIVNFYGLFFSPPSRVGYVCEFCKAGTIHSFLRKTTQKNSKKNFNLVKKLDWMIQIGEGMRYLHQKDVIFRDLKPENILIGKGNILKLTDFGISKIVSNSKNAAELVNMTKAAGTSFYMAPEVVTGKNYDSKVDVFSFAIVIYEILFETVEPFGAQSQQYGIEFSVAQDPEFRPKTDLTFFEEYNKINVYGSESENNIQDAEEFKKAKNVVEAVEAVVSLMKRCWDDDPRKRPNFREIVNELLQIEDKYTNTNNPPTEKIE